MAEYVCPCGKSKQLYKTTTVYRDGKWVDKEAECACGKFMEQVQDLSKDIEVPNVKRTEPSLNKKK